MSENELKHSQLAAYTAGDGEVFEVFQQDLKDPAPHHGGNLLAPDAELALHYAKEFYGRRQESHKLWIVPRSAMMEVSDPTHLPPSLHALPNVKPLEPFNSPASPAGRTRQEQKDIDAPLSGYPNNTHLTTQEQPPQTFAVFVQKQAGKHLTWLQDLEEMSPFAAAEAAMHTAQNSEGGYLRLWLCPRSAIAELTDPDLLQPPLDRSYRRLDGYNIREKLRAARQRVQAQAQGGEQ